MDDRQNKHSKILAANEKAFDLIAEIAAQEEVETVLNLLSSAEAGVTPPEEKAFMDRMDAYFTREAHRYFQRRRIKRFFTRTLPRIARTATIAIAVLAVAGTVALAASRPLRIKVMQLLYAAQEEYTVVTMREDGDASFEVPGEWTEDYYPSYVPDGLRISQLNSDSLGSLIDWADSEGNIRMHLSVLQKDSLVNVDTENADVEFFSDGNIKDGMIVTKGDVMNVVWHTYDRYFLLYVKNFDRETALKIVDGIQRIK